MQLHQRSHKAVQGAVGSFALTLTRLVPGCSWSARCGVEEPSGNGLHRVWDLDDFAFEHDVAVALPSRPRQNLIFFEPSQLDLLELETLTSLSLAYAQLQRSRSTLP